MIIDTESPDQPEIRSMLARLDAYCASLYPAESNHLMHVDSLRPGDEAKRGRGTGRQLLEHIRMFAAMRGLRTLKLETGFLEKPL